MNEFYRNKVSLPRQCKNAKDLRECLTFWKDLRLLHVQKACAGIDDTFRINFGRIHGEYAEKVEEILCDSEIDLKKIDALLEAMETRFKLSGKALMPGWLRDASGLCGAELETIMEKFKNE